MAIALIFPGQGSQQVGMGKALAADHGVARDTFAEVDAARAAALAQVDRQNDRIDALKARLPQP